MAPPRWVWSGCPDVIAIEGAKYNIRSNALAPVARTG